MELEHSTEREILKDKLLIITASASDFPLLSELKGLLRESEIKFKTATISCHRDLDKLPAFIEDVKRKNYEVVIAVANSVSNLPAIIGGGLKNTGIMVIGVGLGNKGLNGIDSLLSVNTIPKGVPMANTGIGEVGLYNAGLIAIKLINGKL